MKLLLDENLPKKLKKDLSVHEVLTARELNWNGIKNGKLLSLMLENNFHVLLSFDQNIQHQQNFEKYSVTVFILIAEINTYKALYPLCLKINNILNSEQSLNKGVIHVQ